LILRIYIIYKGLILKVDKKNQQQRGSCWEGHLLSAYEQNTQQSPGLGVRSTLQDVHS
jgi:hypothetical protein